MGQIIDKKEADLPHNISNDVNALAEKRDILLQRLKKIYSKKFDILKIRTHGNLGLSHILLTGKDIIIHDFGGNPLRPFSERRLKRSPLRDVSAMIRSFYYVAYEGFLTSSQMQADEQNSLLSFADFWAHYMSNFFMKSYMEEIKGLMFIPDSKEDFEILIQSFLLENALYWLNYEIAHRHERVIIPLRIIQSIIN